MPVLPHDPVRVRIDDDDPVVPVVGDRDHPVRPADGERRPVECSRAGRGPVRPDDLPLWRDLVDAPRSVEAGDEDVPVRQELRVGGVGGRRPHRVDEAVVRVETVDPAADLGDQHPAAGQRRRAVGRGERPRRIVGAAGAADLADDAVAAVQAEDAAVLDVGDRDRPVRPDVRVVGVGELACGGAGDARAAVAPGQAMRPDVDLRERVVELLVRDDAAVAGHEEGVVGVAERLAGAEVARARELPDDPLRRGDDQELVRVPVGDQQVPRNRPGGTGGRLERAGGRARRRRGGRWRPSGARRAWSPRRASEPRPRRRRPRGSAARAGRAAGSRRRRPRRPSPPPRASRSERPRRARAARRRRAAAGGGCTRARGSPIAPIQITKLALCRPITRPCAAPERRASRPRCRRCRASRRRATGATRKRISGCGGPFATYVARRW